MANAGGGRYNEAVDADESDTEVESSSKQVNFAISILFTALLFTHYGY